MSALVESNGAPMKGEDGKAAFNSPGSRETMTMWRVLRRWLHSSWSNEESERAFLGGSIGMYAQSVMRLSPYYAAAPGCTYPNFRVLVTKPNGSLPAARPWSS